MSEHWSDDLPSDACREAVAWCRTQPSLEAAWAVCERGDWMLWWAGRRAGPPFSASRRPLVLAACGCARLVLPYVPAGEPRPLQALETAERWGRGEASEAEVRAAANDANDAAYAANAAYAAYAAVDDDVFANADAYDDAYDAAIATANAALCAYSYSAVAAYADTAWPRNLRDCARIVRCHFPSAPALRKEPA